MVQPIDILNVRRVRVRDEWLTQLLVKWDASDRCTWETLDHLQTQFPTFDLEDKVIVDGGECDAVW